MKRLPRANQASVQFEFQIGAVWSCTLLTQSALPSSQPPLSIVQTLLLKVQMANMWSSTALNLV